MSGAYELMDTKVEALAKLCELIATGEARHSKVETHPAVCFCLGSNGYSNLDDNGSFRTRGTESSSARNSRSYSAELTSAEDSSYSSQNLKLARERGLLSFENSWAMMQPTANRSASLSGWATSVITGSIISL